MKPTISKSQKVNKERPPKKEGVQCPSCIFDTNKQQKNTSTSLRKGPGFRPQVTAPQQKSGPKSCPLWSNSMAPLLQVAGSPHPPGHPVGVRNDDMKAIWGGFIAPPVELQLPLCFHFVGVFFLNWKSCFEVIRVVVPEFGNIKTVQHKKKIIRFRFKQKIFSDTRPGP